VQTPRRASEYSFKVSINWRLQFRIRICGDGFDPCVSLKEGQIVLDGTLTSGSNLEILPPRTLSDPNTRHPPNANPAAMAHIVSPTPTSNQTQAEAFAKTGAKSRAPNPSAVKKLRDPKAAASPKAT
jgi:hypothetical protein